MGRVKSRPTEGLARIGNLLLGLGQFQAEQQNVVEQREFQAAQQAERIQAEIELQEQRNEAAANLTQLQADLRKSELEFQTELERQQLQERAAAQVEGLQALIGTAGTDPSVSAGLSKEERALFEGGRLSLPSGGFEAPSGLAGQGLVPENLLQSLEALSGLEPQAALAGFDVVDELLLSGLTQQLDPFAQAQLDLAFANIENVEARTGLIGQQTIGQTIANARLGVRSAGAGRDTTNAQVDLLALQIMLDPELQSQLGLSITTDVDPILGQIKEGAEFALDPFESLTASDRLEVTRGIARALIASGVDIDADPTAGAEIANEAAEAIEIPPLTEEQVGANAQTAIVSGFDPQGAFDLLIESGMSEEDAAKVKARMELILAGP